MKLLVATFLVSNFHFAFAGQVPAKTENAKSNAEAIKTDIDARRLDDITEWVKNSKYILDTGAESISRSRIPEQEGLYVDMIKRILDSSGSKSNEFLMRNILLRTQYIYSHVQSLPSAPKRNAFARRILEEGVYLAGTLYEPDQKLLELAKTKKFPAELRGFEFANLGRVWATYVLGLYYQAPDNTTKFTLMKDMMTLMFNDINDDDAVRRILAPVSSELAVKYEYLKNLTPQTPFETLMAARDLRGFMELHLRATQKLLETYKLDSIETSPSMVAKESVPASEGDFKPKDFTSVYTELLGFKCKDGTGLPEYYSSQVANLAKDGIIDYKRFKFFFYLTCDPIASFEVGKYRNSFNLTNYERIIHLKCENGENHPSQYYAIKTIEGSSAQPPYVDLELFVFTFQKTCEEYTALKAAIAARK